jgi:aspartyl protease family protein
MFGEQKPSHKRYRGGIIRAGAFAARGHRCILQGTSGQERRSVSAWIAIFFLIAAVVTLLTTQDTGMVAGLSTDTFVQVTAGIAVLVFLSGMVGASYRGQFFQAVKHFASWVAVLLVLVGLYAYRTELATVADRVIGELRPEGSQIEVTGRTGTGQAVRIKRGWTGHFIANVRVEGERVDMIVDTGASTVVLRHEDARRLGVDTSELRYSVPVQTANGASYAARLKLPQINIGKVAVRNVEALVARPGSLHQSLLGMSFLSRLRSYEFSGDYLELRG